MLSFTQCEGYYCDRCLHYNTTDSAMYSCRRCNYDLCADGCAGTAGPAQFWFSIVTRRSTLKRQGGNEDEKEEEGKEEEEKEETEQCEKKEEKNEQEEEKEAAAEARVKVGGRIDMALAVQDSLSEPNSHLQATNDRPGPLKGKDTEIELKPSAEFKWLVQEFERSKTKTDKVLWSTRPNSGPAATALGAEASYQPKLTTVELCTSRPDKLHNWDYPKVDANKKNL